MLDPRGLNAERISALWWFMFGLGTAVYVVVMGLLLFAVLRRRDVDERRSLNKKVFVTMGGVVIPVFILLAVLIATVLTERAINAQEEAPDLTIEVVGYQFWWAVRYPEQQIVTANEIHIPVGQPVRVELRSADVIHSFWIPQLHGKLDMFPGRTTSVTLRADQPGEYRGECAEFCGVQHAKMAFVVVALPPEQFAAWLDTHREPPTFALDPLAELGRQVFVEKECVYCHAVRTISDPPEANFIGPDLTYLARRNTLAAGTLDNNRGNLAAWIVDPQAIKPGNKMPPVRLDEDDLAALVAYMESLE